MHFVEAPTLALGLARTWADPPTISAPQYVALLAGVPPRDSGVRTNETLRASGVDDAPTGADAGGQAAYPPRTSRGGISMFDVWPNIPRGASQPQLQVTYRAQLDRESCWAAVSQMMLEIVTGKRQGTTSRRASLGPTANMARGASK
jgi:hypothetical protein